MLVYFSALKVEVTCYSETVYFIGLHGVMSQEINISTMTAVRTLSPAFNPECFAYILDTFSGYI
jgi:hypothetical protein